MAIETNPERSDCVEIAIRERHRDKSLDQEWRDISITCQCREHLAVDPVFHLRQDVDWSVDSIALMTASLCRCQEIPWTAANIENPQRRRAMQRQRTNPGYVERNPETVVSIFCGTGGIAIEHWRHFVIQPLDPCKIGIFTDSRRKAAQPY